MSVEIVQQGDYWVIPCREFAAVQLDRKIRYRYRTKANATRAVLNGKYNLLTTLCFNLERMYTRATLVENLLFKIKTHANQFSEDVWWLEHGCSDVESNGFELGRGDSGAGSGTGGTEGGDCVSAGGFETTDSGFEGSDDSFEGAD